jgi:hypothetical protein
MRISSRARPQRTRSCTGGSRRSTATASPRRANAAPYGRSHRSASRPRIRRPTAPTVRHSQRAGPERRQPGPSWPGHPPPRVQRHPSRRCRVPVYEAVGRPGGLIGGEASDRSSRSQLVAARGFGGTRRGCSGPCKSRSFVPVEDPPVSHHQTTGLPGPPIWSTTPLDRSISTPAAPFGRMPPGYRRPGHVVRAVVRQGVIPKCARGRAAAVTRAGR